MKKTCLIVCTLLAIAHAFASNDVARSSEFAGLMEENVKFKCEDCLLDFGKASKVVISDNNGHVIFYNETVEILDISNWDEGSYTVKIDDKETFKFTL